MKIEIYTHLGGGIDTAACSDVLQYDMFTGHKDLVNCPACLEFVKRRRAKAIRFVVDYDADKASWAVYDIKQSKFVASTTTRHAAQIIRRRMAEWYK